MSSRNECEDEGSVGAPHALIAPDVTRCATLTSTADRRVNDPAILDRLSLTPRSPPRKSQTFPRSRPLRAR